MTVEEDGDVGCEVLEQRQTGGELVDEEGAGSEEGQLGGEVYVEEEVDVAEDGAEDGEAGEEARGDEPAAADANIQGACQDCQLSASSQDGDQGSDCIVRTVATFVEAVGRVAVVREDDDAAAARLQAHGSVDDEPLCAADAQVRVEEDDGALVVILTGARCLGRGRHGGSGRVAGGLATLRVKKERG